MHSSCCARWIWRIISQSSTIIIKLVGGFILGISLSRLPAAHNVWQHRSYSSATAPLIQPFGDTHDQSQDCLDLVIPYHVSDHDVFIGQGGLQSIQRHVQGWRRTWIVSASNDTLLQVLDKSRTIWVPEEAFSFSPSRQRAAGGRPQLEGWHFQQAIKLLAPLEMPDLCNSFLVLDADLQVLRDWNPQDSSAPGRYRYLYPRSFPGDYLVSFGSMAHSWTEEVLGMSSLNKGGTLCTVHHHMVMQKDVLQALHRHVLEHTNGTTLLDKMIDAQTRRWWMSEFDLYLAFAWQRYRERVALVDTPYVHCRERALCTRKDAETFAQETDAVFMACHDNWHGHDVCSGSATNCTSSISHCSQVEGSSTCMAHDYEVLSCQWPRDSVYEDNQER